MSTISYPIRDSLYLNITDRCTLRCAFCPKYNGSRRVHDYDLTLDHRPSETEIMAAIGDPTAYDEVVFCGFGEPTLRLKTLVGVAAGIKAAGGRVRVNTDGLANRVHRRDVLPELAPVVDALSISLNAQNAAVYKLHCRPTLAGSFEAMLDFVASAAQQIEQVTATAIDGLDGVDIMACEALAKARGAAFRRRALDIVG